MEKLFEEVFENDVCKCSHHIGTYDDKEEILIGVILTKRYNQLQIEQRNSVNIAIYECGLWLQQKGFNQYVVEDITSNSDQFSIIGIN